MGSEKNTLGKYIRKESVDLTRIGIFLRRWGLDELPQLWNVLRGEMSLVGPRPTLIYQVEKYDDQQRKRLEAKPGITGWAQVNGNDLLEWPEKIKYDLWYVDNSCVWLDIKIILKTIPTLIRGDFAFPREDMEEDYIVKR